MRNQAKSFFDAWREVKVSSLSEGKNAPALLDSKIRVTTQNRFTLAPKTTDSTERLLVQCSSQWLCPRCCGTLGKQNDRVSFFLHSIPRRRKMAWRFQYHVPVAKLHSQISFAYGVLLLIPKLSLVLVHKDRSWEVYKDESFHKSIHIRFKCSRERIWCLTPRVELFYVSYRYYSTTSEC